MTANMRFRFLFSPPAPGIKVQKKMVAVNVSMPYEHIILKLFLSKLFRPANPEVE